MPDCRARPRRSALTPGGIRERWYLPLPLAGLVKFALRRLRRCSLQHGGPGADRGAAVRSSPRVILQWHPMPRPLFWIALGSGPARPSAKVGTHLGGRQAAARGVAGAARRRPRHPCAWRGAGVSRTACCTRCRRPWRARSSAWSSALRGPLTGGARPPVCRINHPASAMMPARFVRCCSPCSPVWCLRHGHPDHPENWRPSPARSSRRPRWF